MSPGQDLVRLLEALDQDRVEAILGSDLVSGITSLGILTSDPEALRRLAVRALETRADELLARRDVRELLLAAMSPGKLDELATRLGLARRGDLRGYDPTQGDASWRAFAGFFGIDTRGAAPFHSEMPNEPIPTEFGLFPHQRRAANRVWKKLEGSHSRVILHMPTGAGKTRTAIHLVSRFLSNVEPGLVVWLATTSELLDQAAEAFKSAWPRLGNRELQLVRYWGDYNGDLADATDGFLVAGLQKLHALSQRDSLEILKLANKVRLVVVDEAHQAIAPTYASLINRIADAGSHHAVLGLTATPGRTWADIAQDERLAAFFENNKVMLEVEGYPDPVAYLMAEGYLAKPEFRVLKYEVDSELAGTLAAVGSRPELTDSEIEKLALNNARNRAVLDEVERLISEGHTRIILFAASVRHAELISAALYLSGIDAPIVTGTTGSILRQRTVRRFRDKGDQPIVLCNFGVLTTGFDAPNTSAAIIARPTKSLVLYSQMVGRATRGPKAGGNEHCVISTVVDVSLPGFGDVAEAFTNWEDIWND